MSTTEQTPPAEETVAMETEPLPSGADISPEQDGGVVKQIVRAAPSDAESPYHGDTVSVHYVGTLLNGEQFDSSRDRDQLFEFQLGEGNVIKGWDIGVATMKKGELAVLTCQPKYGYGESGSPPKIPGNSVLKFEVELIGFHGEDLSPDKDFSIERRVMVKGDGFKTPADGTKVKVQLKGACNNTTFDDRVVEFTYGELEDDTIPEGVEIAVSKMKKNEQSAVTVKPSYGFREEGCASLGVPADATLNYQLTLLDLEKVKESWEMDLSEKVSEANRIKLKGTDYFKENKYRQSIAMYRRANDLLDVDDEGVEGEEGAQIVKLKHATHLNLALCYLKTGSYLECVQQCDEVLAKNTEEVKAYFRRGQAYLLQNEFTLAKSDFRQVLDLEPDNKSAKSQLNTCLVKLKQQHDKEKRIYANMFTKFAEQDAKVEKKPSAGSNKVTNGDAEPTPGDETPTDDAAMTA